jgi:hypothetical protein
LKSRCPEIRQLLSEYIDGVLDATEMTAVKEHLQGCDNCSRDHEALISMIRELGNIGMVKAPDNFLEKFHDRIRDDSFFDRLREIFSFMRVRFPVELAAFAVTALLILFFFNFFPNEEKLMNPGNDSTQSAMNHQELPAQTNEDRHLINQPVIASNQAAQTRENRVPVKLALSLITEQEINPIPSQSVSYGNSETGTSDQGLDIWPPEIDSVKTILQPDDVNLKIDEMVKAVEGTLISRDYRPETGYPAHLTLDIPAGNYRLFITKIKTLGSLNAPAPALPDGSEETGVLVQVELTPQQ